VELGACIAEALLAGAEGAEVLYRLGYDIVEKLKVDAARVCCGSVSAVDLAACIDGCGRQPLLELCIWGTWRGRVAYSSRRPWR
jgi:hypothetical protein